MSGEIVKAEATHQLAERVRLTEQGLAVELEQRKLLNRFVRTCMVSGTDYGVIPGTDKPTLLKPGAEKLVDLFRCTPEFVIDASVTDFDKGMFYYRFKVRLFSEADWTAFNDTLKERRPKGGRPPRQRERGRESA